jgi:hypothetical protein
MGIASLVSEQLNELAQSKGVEKALKLLLIAKREEVNQKRGTRRKPDLIRYLANLILNSETEDEGALGLLFGGGGGDASDDDDGDEGDGTGPGGIPRLSIRVLHKVSCRC